MSTISVNFKDLTQQQAYKILIGSIVPRPIAWVTTISNEGIVNAAPFSFFTGVGSNPPSLLFCITQNPDGSNKDTLNNIQTNGEFVVNVVSENLTNLMNDSSKAYPPHVSEVEVLKIDTVKSDLVKPPRIKESPIQLECKKINIFQIGEPKTVGSSNIIVGEILKAHFLEEVYNPETGYIDITKVKPVSRLGGLLYAKLGTTFELKRP